MVKNIVQPVLICQNIAGIATWHIGLPCDVHALKAASNSAVAFSAPTIDTAVSTLAGPATVKTLRVLFNTVYTSPRQP
jgi:hypothetical protein